MNEDRKQKQIDIAERLQDLLLAEFERKLESGELSDTGLSTLSRLLMQNGWTIDPSRLPHGLKDKLTQSHDPNAFDEDDDDVLPMRAWG
jgi:hypothetical protein